MPNNEKAKKLAAAKKKLKAYQSGAASNSHANKDTMQPNVSLKNELREELNVIDTEQEKNVLTTSGNDGVPLKEIADSGNNLTSVFQSDVISDNSTTNFKNMEVPSLQNYFDTSTNSFLSFFNQQQQTEPEQQPQIDLNSTLIIPQEEQFLNLSSGTNMHSVLAQCETTVYDNVNNASKTHLEKPGHIKTIELLIAEKGNLCAELTNYQTLCKEKEFEIEELKIRLQSSKNQIEDLEKHFFIEQKKASELEKKFKKYEIETSKTKNEVNDFKEHLNELKHELAVERKQNYYLENQIREKNNQLELNAIRINQISDETSITIDNRIEKLTQTKFMYEQQILDLQAIVQQLRTEKESANQQYQSYVQHLNKDILTLSEKNSELLDENEKLKFRENDLIHHISGLEKQIQQNIARNESLRDIKKTSSLELDSQKIKELEEKLKAAETANVNLKQEIAVNSSAAADYKKTLDTSLEKISELEERLENITSGRPNDLKLLAQIESDKVAASRAMTQNAELRKQLDELQLKLIDLVNDKAELTNKLDSEIHANKEIRCNYENFEQQLQSLTEKLHYKDEEMIRLSHENVLLNEKLNDINLKNVNIDMENISIHEHHQHNHQHCDQAEKPLLLNGNSIEQRDIDENQPIEVAKEAHCLSSSSKILPTNEAMQKLEQRFTSLMGEVADLTDEKQRLEHLVLQLQGETETIGEYIALYQTQRRQLKQKEIEKDTQLYRLKAEREELKDNLSKLNQLIGTLGLNPDFLNTRLQEAHNQTLTNGSDNNSSIQSADNAIVNRNNAESKKIIHQIHTLITEIKDKEDSLLNSTIVDHCACCQGSLETI